MTFTASSVESIQATAVNYLCAKAGCQLEFNGNDAVMYYLGQLCLEGDVPESAFDELITSTATHGATGRARDHAHAQACRINQEGHQAQMAYLFDSLGIVRAHEVVTALIDAHRQSSTPRQRAA